MTTAEELTTEATAIVDRYRAAVMAAHASFNAEMEPFALKLGASGLPEGVKHAIGTAHDDCIGTVE